MTTMISRREALATAVVAALGLNSGCGGGDVKVADAPPPQPLPNQPPAESKKAPPVGSRSKGNPDDYTR